MAPSNHIYEQAEYYFVNCFYFMVPFVFWTFDCGSNNKTVVDSEVVVYKQIYLQINLTCLQY